MADPLASLRPEGLGGGSGKGGGENPSIVLPNG
jgi:hypothetical protein